MTACAKALQIWSEKNDGANPEEADEIALLALIPSITKMDASLNVLAKCKKLSLSTNQIDRMIPLPGLKNLEILSLGRNMIKRIQGLEEVGGTLKELWISYNHISSLDGLHPCVKLTTLFISNNKIAKWEELSKLTQLPDLSNILLLGNPIYDQFQGKRQMAVPVVAKHLPGLKTLDGEMLTGDASDDQLMAIRDAILAKGGESVEEAFGGAGMDLNGAVDKAGFVTAVASFGVSKDDAEYAFDQCAADGQAPLRAIADLLDSA